MAQNKKDLYLCKTLEELVNSTDTPALNSTGTSGKNLFNSAERLVTEARKANKTGDEEQAYILYMRAASLYMKVKESPMVQKDPKDLTYYQHMMKTNLLESIETAETLKRSLRTRYSNLQPAKQGEVKAKVKVDVGSTAGGKQQKPQSPKTTREVKSVHSGINGFKKAPSPSPSSENDEDSQYNISVQLFKNLIEQKATRLLIVDCRSRSDFISSHVNHPSCLSIPQEIVLPGVSAVKMEGVLKEKQPDAFHSWNKRGEYDRIVLYDWNSSYNNMQSTITALFHAMIKWDVTNKYKSPPCILQGGFRNLYYMYPMLIKNPDQCRNNLTKFEESRDSNESKKDLSRIEYPDIDDTSVKSEKQAKMTNIVNGGVSGTISIDRSTKPKPVIVPVHKPNIANNGIDNKVNGIVTHSLKPTLSNDAIKVGELNTALDEVIRYSTEIKKKEDELEEIMEKTPVDNNSSQTRLLQAKEEEIENLQRQLKEKDEAMTRLKDEYDANEKKRSLPQVRLSEKDLVIAKKLEEKQDLQNYVREIRARRKEKENAINSHVDPSGKLPTIPGSGASSPYPPSRTRVNKSESSTFPPIVNSSNSNNNGFGGTGSEVKNTPSGSPLLRPMSQDATTISHQKLKDGSGESPRQSLLKRSHSHPNIAQSLSEEDASFAQNNHAASQVPQFNRGLKPSPSGATEFIPTPSRARQFHAISSTEKHKTGLKNLGNTCYMNSIVQSLYHLPGLTEFFTTTDKWKAHVRLQKRVTNGDISTEFQAVLTEMYKGHRSIAIHDFRKMVGRYHPSFSGFDQQDSHEFLTILLDWLHEELNQMRKSPLSEQKNDGLSDTDAANKAWAEYCSSNKSKIMELFCGQQKSVVRCLTCDKASVTFELFYNLSVPIPTINNRKVDIHQCIDLYTKEEILVDWNCPYCKTTGRATKKIDLWRLPPYLIIHLQRFYNDGWWKKRLTEVDFPVDSLDLTTRVKGAVITPDQRIPRSNFMLQAVSNHYGSMDGGHYTAYCRKLSQWSKFDDLEVSSINARDVVTPAAYILFYCNNSP